MFFEPKKKNAPAADAPPTDADIESAAAVLYKQNLELAVKNKTLSLLRQLYQISILALEPGVVAEKIAVTVREALDFELVAILNLDELADLLAPIATSRSERLEKSAASLGYPFATHAITNTRKIPFLAPLYAKESNHTEHITDLWGSAISEELLKALTEDGHLKMLLAHPLVIDQKVNGILVFGLNREYEKLSTYERESIGSLVDVTSVALDRARLYEALKVSNEKLKELDKLKSQFLSMASHDLRAPLTIIRNFISLILEGAYGTLAPAGKEGLQQVFDRATDMAKSVETYLDVSRIEQGRMKYDFVDIELLPLVKNAVTAFTPNAEKKGLKLSATYDSALSGVRAKIDVSKMNEILNNLLDNTIKYTPTGSMNLRAEKAGAIARITLKDTGVGMSADTLKNLFQLFRPGEDSKRINPASTGVGLYVTKAHVEAHSGKIWAESEGVGKGSTFILELPLLS